MHSTNAAADPIHEAISREESFYKRFAYFWHVVTYGQLAWAAYQLVRAGSQITTRTAVICIALLIVQGILYWRAFIASDWPPRGFWLWLHFGAGLTICLAYYWLEPSLTLLAWQYAGHMMGTTLPLTRALPVFVAASVIGSSSTVHHWRFVTLDRGDWLGVLLPLLGVAASHWFIQRGMSFGQQQRELLMQLQTANRELEAARTRERDTAALRERERLARDMHDTLGHSLVALSVQLEATQRLYRVNPDAASQQMDQLKHLTRDSVAMLRRTITGLRASEFDGHPLDAALQVLSVEMGRQSGLTVTCDIAGDCSRVTGEPAEILWFVTKEALMNIQKHARATQVSVRLTITDDSASVVISDNGVGLSPGAEDKPDRFGLRGMRERVVAQGGALAVGACEAGRGTRLEARLPL